MGRLLDVISENCRMRGEPSLAPLVVNGAAREVGADYEGAPEADRQRLYDYTQGVDSECWYTSKSGGLTCRTAHFCGFSPKELIFQVLCVRRDDVLELAGASSTQTHS